MEDAGLSATAVVKKEEGEEEAPALPNQHQAVSGEGVKEGEVTQVTRRRHCNRDNRTGGLLCLLAPPVSQALEKNDEVFSLMGEGRARVVGRGE